MREMQYEGLGSRFALGYLQHRMQMPGLCRTAGSWKHSPRKDKGYLKLL